jgi:hypothetical protein
MVGEDLRIPIAQPPKQPSRPLDVTEEKRKGPRKLGHKRTLDPQIFKERRASPGALLRDGRRTFETREAQLSRGAAS